MKIYLACFPHEVAQNIAITKEKYRQCLASYHFIINENAISEKEFNSWIKTGLTNKKRKQNNENK